MANEKRLIDANALLGRAIREKRFVFQREDLLRDEIIVKTVYGDLAEFINEQPTVDAVEVVRCKDCEYSQCNPVELTYACRHPSGLRGFVNEGFYFCPHGERSWRE